MGASTAPIRHILSSGRAGNGRPTPGARRAEAGVVRNRGRSVPGGRRRRNDRRGSHGATHAPGSPCGALVAAPLDDAAPARRRCAGTALRGPGGDHSPGGDHGDCGDYGETQSRPSRSSVAGVGLPVRPSQPASR